MIRIWNAFFLVAAEALLRIKKNRSSFQMVAFVLVRSSAILLWVAMVLLMSQGCQLFFVGVCQKKSLIMAKYDNENAQ